MGRYYLSILRRVSKRRGGVTMEINTKVLSEALGVNVTEIIKWKTTKETIAYKVDTTLSHQFINTQTLKQRLNLKE